MKTSVCIDNSEYLEFKVFGIRNSINLQELVNSTIQLFNSSSEFRKIILSHNELLVDMTEKTIYDFLYKNINR